MTDKGSLAVPALLPLPIDKNPFLKDEEDIKQIEIEPIIDDLELNLEKQRTPAKIYYYYHVFSRLNLNYSILDGTQSTQGGNNTTFFSPNSKFLLRITKKSSKSLYIFNGRVATTDYGGHVFLGYTYPFNYKPKEDVANFNNTKNILQHDEMNIIRANQEKISPQLYYIGNILYNDGRIYRFMIMEKYDGTLTDFLERTILTIQDEATKKEIYHSLGTQLVEHLDNTYDILNIVCYDIKPANCVVKQVGDAYILKLIDWDSDYCKTEVFEVDKIVDIGNCIKFFNLLILANFLYLRHNQNFLCEIVRQRYNEEKWNSWIQIFTDFDKQYSKHMIHYFYRDFMIDSPQAQQIRQSIENKQLTPQERQDIKKLCEKNALTMLQNAYKFDSTPPVSLEAARAETPTPISRTRSQSKDDLQRLLDSTNKSYPDTIQPIQGSPKIQRKGGKSRKKRSRKRR